jgi:hypothetical protein
LPVPPTIILIPDPVVRLIVWVVFPPFSPALGAGLTVFRICGNLLAMIIRSPAALAFG